MFLLISKSAKFFSALIAFAFSTALSMLPPNKIPKPVKILAPTTPPITVGFVIVFGVLIV